MTQEKVLQRLLTRTRTRACICPPEFGYPQASALHGCITCRAILAVNAADIRSQPHAATNIFWAGVSLFAEITGPYSSMAPTTKHLVFDLRLVPWLCRAAGDTL